MVTLENKFGPFGEVGGSNSKFGLVGNQKITETWKRSLKKIQRRSNQVLVIDARNN